MALPLLSLPASIPVKGGQESQGVPLVREGSYHKVDEGDKGQSLLGWENFMSENVFGKFTDVVADDVELCQIVHNYVSVMKCDLGVPCGEISNPKSRLWFDLLHTVGWLNKFLSTESVSKPLETEEFTHFTNKWFLETGLDWRTWFKLLCYLRSVKRTILRRVSTNTLDELLCQYHTSNVAGDSYLTKIAAIGHSSDYGKKVIRLLRVGTGALCSERKVTSEQWCRIQQIVLTIYNVAWNNSNLKILNIDSKLVVNGLSLTALAEYFSQLYYNALALHSPMRLRFHSIEIVNGDRVFIDHMLSKDLENYQYIRPIFRTQADADMLSADRSAIKLVDPDFRMSATFIVNAFKYNRTGLLVPGGVDKLAGLGIDSDELFNRVLEVVGTVQSNIADDWKEWFKGHVETLTAMKFDEEKKMVGYSIYQKKVVSSNPNTIMFFLPKGKWRDSFEAKDDVIDMLETVITAEKNVAADATELALDILEYMYAFKFITRERYMGLLYKGIELKNDSVLEHVLNNDGETSNGVLKAIDEGGLSLSKNLVTAVTMSFPIEDFILPLFLAVEEHKWIRKDVVQAVLKETKVLLIAYSDPEKYHGYAYAITAQRDGYIERADLIKVISMALRTGHEIAFDSEFNELAYEEKIFTVEELSLLLAAQKEKVSFLDSTFKVLYLAMIKAPEKTAIMIRHLLVVQPGSGDDKMDTTDDVAQADPAKGKMVVTLHGYIFLQKLYGELTGKTL